MNPSRNLTLAAGSLLIACGLPSCTDKEAQAELSRVREDLSHRELEIDELKGQVKRLKETAEKAAEAKPDTSAEDLQKANEESEELKREIEKLKEDNKKLQSQITAKIRDRAVGEKHEKVTASNGKTYHAVTIRKIDDTGVSIAHQTGMTTLRADTAPPAWVERFLLVDEAALQAAAVAVDQTAGEPEVDDPAPSSLSKSEKRELVESKLGGVLILENDTGKGSGFIAAQDGGVYLYTAAHVLTGGKNLVIKNSSGATLTNLGACQVAADCDLARIEVTVKPGLALELAKPGEVVVGQDIRAAGNSAGSGVVTLLNGRISGLGPTELEVSAGVVKGNSGGPVFSAETGEVIGVVSRAEAGNGDIWSAGSKFAKVRRFASRLDRPIPWKSASLESLQTENARLATFDSRTRLAYALAALEPGQSGLRLDMRMGGGQGPTVLEIFKANLNLPPVKRLIEMNGELGDRQLRTSEKDLARRFASFYQDLLRLFADDTASFDPAHYSPPNQKRAARSMAWRREATQLLKLAAANLGR